jgi:hypothetical protein
VNWTPAFSTVHQSSYTEPGAFVALFAGVWPLTRLSTGKRMMGQLQQGREMNVSPEDRVRFDAFAVSEFAGKIGSERGICPDGLRRTADRCTAARPRVALIPGMCSAWIASFCTAISCKKSQSVRWVHRTPTTPYWQVWLDLHGASSYVCVALFHSLLCVSSQAATLSGTVQS